MLTCKQAAPEDIPVLYALCRRLIDAYEQTDAIDYPKVLSWVQQKLRQSIQDYTAVYRDGEKVGYYHFFPSDNGRWELDDLYVFPEFQGQGIGTQILRTCCERCQSAVELCVFTRNTGAIALYRRMGFQVEAPISATRCRMVWMPRKYYAAYDERYKTAHRSGVTWASAVPSPIVLETLEKYGISPKADLLEIGCGEGRDARAVLSAGYCLTATDISPQAIAYCRQAMPAYADRFRTLDRLADSLDQRFDFLYGVAVVHMLVLDEDRDRFYGFVHRHLKPEGLALICTMGDGEIETQSDICQAFTLQDRCHQSGKMLVAGTSCRMVSFQTFSKELERNRLQIVEQGLTSALPDFNSLMFAVVKQADPRLH